MDPIQQEDDWQWEKSGENAWSLNANVPAEVSSDEDEDYPKAKLGAGHWGIGPPLTSTLMGKRKPFADGFGLCSPGRWPPAQRRSAASTPALGLMEALGAELEKLLRGHCDVRKLAMQLAAGKVVESPFSDAAIAEGRELIFVTLELAGTHLPVRQHVPNQPFLFAAIEELLRLSLDPDYKAYKLGVVQVPGKKPRLVGDGTVSGANRRCRLSGKIRVPSLESVQRFVSLVPESTALCALSFDIRGAHKLVRVHPREQGYSTFVFEDTWYVYRTCYFGARWSAYWFGRVGAQLTRFLHQFIYICHGLFLYIDVGLLLVPAEVAPLVACTALMFLVALGVRRRRGGRGGGGGYRTKNKNPTRQCGEKHVA